MQESTGRSQATDRTVLQTDQARQGVTGHNVRYVLAYGLFGAIVAVAAVGFLTGIL